MEMQDAVGILRRRWWVIALSVVLGLLLGIGLTASTDKTYTASSRVFLRLPGTTVDVDLALNANRLSAQLMSTYAKIVNTQATTTLIARDMNGKFTRDEVSRKVSAVPVAATLLLDLKATDHDPRVAAELANAAAKALRTVVSDLEATKAGGGINASIVDRAEIPKDPTAPVPRKNLTVGLLAGLALGAIAAVALDLLDRTIRTPSTVSDVYDVPFLGSIPRQRRLNSAPLAALSRPGSPTGESYRVLRTAIRYRDATNPLKTVLVTSGSAGEGKTTVAANLAIAMAQDGLKVILIDADFRRGRIADLFDVPASPGLSNVLLGKVKLRDALTSWGRGLSVLAVGSSGLNPSEALGSNAMKALLAEAKAIADIVIIDAPPVLPVTDPAVLSALVDGTVIVARWGRTSLHAAVATRQTLENVGAEIVGVVLNAEGGGRSSNYYRHYSARPAHRRRDRDGDENGLLPRVDEGSQPSNVS